MPIETKATPRGFQSGQFLDDYGEECSIQESSSAMKDAIWLGCNNNSPTDEVTGLTPGPRMHLTQEMVADLLPLLTHFVETGMLPRLEPEGHHD